MPGSRAHGAPAPRWIAPATRRSRSRASASVHSRTARSSRACSRRSRRRRSRLGRARPPKPARRRFVRKRKRTTEMLGKLTWDAIPWDQPIPLGAGAGVLIIVLAVVAWLVVAGHVPYLWREWITSVDHKRIGVMYTLLGLLMLFRGFIDALMIRSQQALAFQGAGYLPPEHFNQVFSAHGT